MNKYTKLMTEAIKDIELTMWQRWKAMRIAAQIDEMMKTDRGFITSTLLNDRNPFYVRDVAQIAMMDYQDSRKLQ